MVRYLYAALLLHGVVVEVDIGAFIEAVVRGLVRRRREVVVGVREAGSIESARVGRGMSLNEHSQGRERHLALLWRHAVYQWRRRG